MRGKARFSWIRQPRILFVCTANICRSPMAESILRKACADAGLDWDIDSAATHDYMIGMPPSALAVEVAKRRGCDISKVAARRVRLHDFRYFDLILAMDRHNLSSLRLQAPRSCRGKIRLLLEYGREYHGLSVPDPYSAGPFAFERAFEMIDDGCHGLMRHLCRLPHHSRWEGSLTVAQVAEGEGHGAGPRMLFTG